MFDEKDLLFMLCKLINGTEMFYGAGNLSGQCRPKPSSLTSYSNMYRGTKVECDYGK